jgi:hypothetical protein
MSRPEDSLCCISKMANRDNHRPLKCDPCGSSNLPICGKSQLTCRPAGRQWGRACGPVSFNGSKWIVPEKKLKRCKPLKIQGKGTGKRMPYGFGLYARSIFPCGVPCVGNFILKKPKCNKFFYPMLPTKPGKIYSAYTFSNRGPPYTCPRVCISNDSKE